MIRSSELRRLNRRFGDEFGYNPHNMPNFRWERTTNLFRHVDHGTGLRRRDSGVVVWEKKFEPKCWADTYGVCWILVKWKFYTEQEWYLRAGTSMPYPKKGEWEPVENIRLGPQYPERPADPCLESTLEACAAIRADRDRLSRSCVSNPLFDKVRQAEIEMEDQRKHDSAISSHMSKLDDILRDAVPAYGMVPGTHRGSTEFMSGIKQEKK